MEIDYKKIIDVLIDNCLPKESVLAVMITGSFARGINNKDSDLDVQIVISNASKYRKRGNVVIDGVLVEYCINPYQQVKKYLEIDFQHNNPMMCFALLEAKIVFEKYKSATRLKEYAKKTLKTKYRMISQDETSFKQYVLADTLNKMNSLYKKQRDDFSFLYFANLKLIYETYAIFLRQPLLKEPMLLGYFDGNSRFNHVVKSFPDKHFSKLFLHAITVKDIKDQINIYRTLTQYVLKKMGKFNLNGWSLMIPVDYSNTMDKRTRVF